MKKSVKKVLDKNQRVFILVLSTLLLFELVLFVDYSFTGNVIVKTIGENLVGETELVQQPICTSTTEICDGKDNDCDSQLDEGGVCESVINVDEISEPKFNGYIVQLQDNPIIQYKINQEKNSLTKSVSQQSLTSYKSNIISKQNNLEAQIKNLHSSAQIDSKVQNVFNGFAVYGINEEQAKQLESLPEVKKVYPNYEVHRTLMDSIPLIGTDQVWNMQVSGINLTGEGITIGIIDTGVDYTHPDFGGCFGAGCKVVNGWDFVNDDSNPIDDMGHGTHVASIAAGKGVLNGVAPDATIYAYKVLNHLGNGNSTDIIAAIEKSVDYNQDGNFSDHLDIISLSLTAHCLGIYNENCGPDDPMSTVVDNAVGVGVVAIIAADNLGPGPRTIGSPGAARKAITVGATYKKNYENENYAFWGDVNPRMDQIVSFSSRGPIMLDEEEIIKPDILAPGAIICAARYDSIFPNNTNIYYYPCFDDEHVQLAGTSMSTPIVSGSVALLKQAHPDWTPEDIKSALMITAKDLGYDANTQGAGRIDVLKAINPPFMTSPLILDFGIIDVTNQILPMIISKELLIRNLKPYDITLILNITNATNNRYVLKTHNISSVNVSSLTIGANSNASVNISLYITPGITGSLDGSLLITENGKIFHVPYTVNLFSYNIFSCADLILEGEYFLNADIIESVSLTDHYDRSACITIIKNNTVLDCQGHTIEYKDVDYHYFYNYGIRAYGSSASQLQNVTTKNCIIKSSNVGLNYVYINNGSITNSILEFNNDFGIRLVHSNYNSLSNITVKSSPYLGIELENSNYNILSNMVLTSNDIGVDLWRNSNYNILSNMVLTSNDIGVDLAEASGNTIKNNTIENNAIGLSKYFKSGLNGPNLIYNNLFNNTKNYAFSGGGTNLKDFWNITLNCSGSKNIVGGNCMGGNYWAYPNVTGFSDTCIDTNKNGICDSNYTLGANNIDYLPLTKSPPIICGDVNGDGLAATILDLTFLIDRIFRGGPAPNPPERGDVNGDGVSSTILDLTYMIDRIFRGGPPAIGPAGCATPSSPTTFTESELQGAVASLASVGITVEVEETPTVTETQPSSEPTIEEPIVEEPTIIKKTDGIKIRTLGEVVGETQNEESHNIIEKIAGFFKGLFS